MEKIRFGIIGYGTQGKRYAKLLTGTGNTGFAAPEFCTLGAICEIDGEKGAEIRELYPDIPFFTDWREMVDSDAADAFITTVPHYLHHEIAIYCLEHGRHVLVEKPAGVRAKDVLQMNQCAEKHPELTFGIMFNQRTNELYQKIRALVRSGELGEIRRSNWILNSWWRPDSYYRQSAWRATWGGEGGGILVNQAPHQLDLWQWICGVPARVTSININGAHRDIHVENDVTILTEYENGSTGCLVACTHDPVGTDRLEIDLSGGKIVVENSQKATVYKFFQSEEEMNANLTTRDLAALTAGNASIGPYEKYSIEVSNRHTSGHLNVMENFARHILTGSPLIAPGADGIMGVNLANASQLSSWLGKTVDLPVDPELYAEELNKRIAEEGLYPVRR